MQYTRTRAAYAVHSHLCYQSSGMEGCQLPCGVTLPTLYGLRRCTILEPNRWVHLLKLHAAQTKHIITQK